METHAVLKALSARTPLFEKLPVVAHKRIIGTESEYGVHNTVLGDQPVIASAQLPMMLRNGGEVYEDCGHVEYASPETSNPVAAVAYYEAGKVFAWNEHLSPALFCHNNDWDGHTFGAHENYLTCAPRTAWRRLIPFLVARTVVCGAGWLNNRDCFEISQRAHTITCAQSTDTTANRAVLNMRPESVPGMAGFARLHLISGDATMSEVATLLRLGTTSCVLEMLEKGALPDVSYDDASAPDDMQAVSRRDWILRGVSRGPRCALELLACYAERAAALFAGRDDATDAVLIIWKDTLEKLAREPMLLWRRLDWVAKLFLLRTFKEHAPGEPEKIALRSQDMAYHSLNPAEGLYYYLVQAGEMERVVDDRVIIRAVHEPPPDTRAFVRGKSVQWLEDTGRQCALCANSWDYLSLIDAAARGFSRVQKAQHPRCYLSMFMPNPRKTYEHLLKRIQMA